MQACDSTSHLDWTQLLVAPPTSTQDTAIANFGNIMTKDALEISYLDIFQASTAITARCPSVLVFLFCKVWIRIVTMLGQFLTVATSEKALRVSLMLLPWPETGLNVI